MAHTSILPPSVMNVKPQSAVAGLNWTQLPGTATSAAAAADGSLWVLSDLPSGADKYIWHYVGGSWTNISGLASQIAVAPDGTLYAINSGGGTYSYNAGVWTALGGGASGITTAADGSFYVLSNGGTGPDRAIWHNVGGAWSQVPGSGVAIAGSFDGSYTLPGGTISHGGLYIVNSQGSMYYENTGGSFVQLPANASLLAPTTAGGVYALGYPANADGNSIYYYDLNAPGWSVQSGAGVSLTSNAGQLYVIGASGAIYTSPVTVPWSCKNAQFLSDQSAFANHTISGDQPVDVCGSVTQVLAEKDTSSGHHGYFYVKMPSGYQIEIVSNLDAMSESTATSLPPTVWPWVAVGDYVYVQGRYYYDNASSQGIDWTENNTSGSWPQVGWVVVNGTFYN